MAKTYVFDVFHCFPYNRAAEKKRVEEEKAAAEWVEYLFNYNVWNFELYKTNPLWYYSAYALCSYAITLNKLIHAIMYYRAKRLEEEAEKKRQEETAAAEWVMLISCCWYFIDCHPQMCSNISYLVIGRAARLKEEQETKARKEAATKRMAEAKARAEVSDEYLISCPTFITSQS